MATQGWIPVNRQLQEHWLWKDKPFSKGQAWIDLLMLANHEDKKIPYKGEIITCERGTVNLSVSLLASRWGWSRDKTRNFLKLLESDEMVVVNATTHRTTITIENYALYNDRRTTKRQQNDSKPTASRQQADTTNNDNNDNNKNNNKNIYGEFKNVVLSEEELAKLKAKIPNYEDYIERLSAYMASKGKRYKSHYATILAWARKEKKGESDNAGDKRTDTEPTPERKLGTYL